jgi:hypothetical protein
MESSILIPQIKRIDVALLYQNNISVQQQYPVNRLPKEVVKSGFQLEWKKNG